MNRFVEECRAEWKRLGVPDRVAEEMAAELTADLAEAEAEGASAEDLLGLGASDPRSFAATWAVERGVVRWPGVRGRGRRRRIAFAAAIAAFALTGIGGAVLMLVGSSSTSERLAVASPGGPPASRVALVRVDGPIVYSPDGRSGASVVTYDMSPAPAPPPLLIPEAGLVTVETDESAFDARTVGLLLMTAGIAGLLPSVLFWLWVGPGRPAAAR